MAMKIKDYKTMPELDILKEIYDSLDPDEKAFLGTSPKTTDTALYTKIKYIKNEAAGSLQVLKDPKTKRAEIYIAVKPKFRREGVAYELITRALNIISGKGDLFLKNPKWKGVTRVYYTTTYKNIKSVQLAELLVKKFGLVKDEKLSNTSTAVYYWDLLQSEKEKN